MGHAYEGLALPPTVFRKLFHDNGVRWVPGVGVNGTASLQTKRKP